MSPEVTQRTKILDPRGDVSNENHQLADRLEDLSGTTVGFLNNSKTNADVFLEELSNVLREEYGVENVEFRRKDNASIPAGPIASTLHETCDAVVNAYGDCGSCTSWCVYDSVELERMGTPTATINSDEFVKLGQSETRALGLPGLPLVTVPHPLGGIDTELVRGRARTAAAEVVRVLTTDRDELDEEYTDKYLDADETLGDEDLYCPIY